MEKSRKAKSKVRGFLGRSRCLIFEVQKELQKASGERTPCEKWGCSSAGRAPALQAGGHRFDPVHLHQDRDVQENKGARGRTAASNPRYGLIAQPVRAHA